MRQLRDWWGRTSKLDTVFANRANSVGFLRLALALGVLVGHSWPLGKAEPGFGTNLTGKQADLGELGVLGFFVLSGFLITASGARFGIVRFAWHRFLRIFPGFWVCLLATALIMAPLLAIHTHGSTAGLWSDPHGPLQYLRANWWTGMRQWGIADLLTTTPYAKLAGGASVFDGSLWTLMYELLCYVVVGVLCASAVLRKAPRLVPLLAAGLYAIMLFDYYQGVRHGNLRADVAGHPAFGPFPLIGAVSGADLLPLLFIFMLGATFHLYRDRVPMHWGLMITAAVVTVLTLAVGGFMPIGTPAYGYLIMALACYLPRWLHGVGRKRDYSYGIYIYAFPMQQLIALLVGLRWGFAAYIGLTLVSTVVLAALSWHLVERPAMRLKDWTPSLRRRRAEPPATRAPADADTELERVPAAP
jgi:peptidoglycan/LPS O-acetylase OafA/YrhL